MVPDGGGDQEVDAGRDAAPPDECGCADGFSCLRGACVATCETDLEELDAALGERLEVLAHYCVRPQAVATVGDDVIQVDATRDIARDVFRITLGRWTPSDDPTPAARSLGRTEFPDAEGTLSVDDIRVAPGAESALVTVRSYDAGGGGGHALFSLSDASEVDTDPVAALDSPVLLDGATYVHQLSAQLVRGGRGGARSVAELRPLGSFLPGELDVWREEGLLVAGFARRSGASEADPTIYFVPITEVATSETALDLAADERVRRNTDLPYDDFTMLPGGRFIDREDGVGMRRLSRGRDGLEVGERVVIGRSTDVFYRVLALGDDLLLPHSRGILRVAAPR